MKWLLAFFLLLAGCGGGDTSGCSGTFTPTLPDLSATVLRAEGFYSRVGDEVTFNARVKWLGGVNGGTVAVGGLPYPSAETIQLVSVALNQETPTLFWEGTPVAWLNGSTIVNLAAASPGTTWFSILNPSAGAKDVTLSGSYTARKGGC